MDTNHLDLMGGGDVFLLAKRVVDQSWDRGKVCRKIGGRDELLQTVSELLLEVRAGEVVFDQGRQVSFYGFVMGKARWVALEKNWMLEAPRVKRPEPAQPLDKDKNADAREGDDEEVEPPRLQTVTPPAGGSDAQAELDVNLDDHDGAGHSAWALGLLDDHDGGDDGLTPAHQLLLHADPAVLADLLGCTNRTIYNMLSRSRDRQALAEKVKPYNSPRTP